MATVLEAVNRGSSLLDLRRPGWYREINLATLNIASGRDCMCGQLFGGFGEGLNALSVGGNAAYYGFSGQTEAFADLTSAWREEIARRRLAEIPQPVAV